ncbi:MAG: NYN domain-containing protein [Burkholderiales bacterium]|nr:NYN domain-containing protein [Burkholderiales bacterium]
MSAPLRQANYLFIDGGYFRRVMADRLFSFVGSEVRIRWDFLRTRTNATRVFYYDSVDNEKRQSETESEYQTRLDQQNNYISAISASPGYFLRLGSVSGSSGKRRQKEVDVLLAVDMLTHSHNKNMELAILVAGDKDFKPVVDALVNQGTIVKVMTDKRSGSRELMQAADSADRLGLRALWSFTDGPNRSDASQVLPIQLDINQKLPSEAPAQVGMLHGQRVSLWQTDGRWVASLPHSLETLFQTNWAFHDEVKLKEFLECDFGPIEWQ